MPSQPDRWVGLTSIMDFLTLSGRAVQLVPLNRTHLRALEAIAFDPAIWRYMLVRVGNRAELESWIEAALAAPPDKQITWVTLLKSANSGERVVGSTRLIDIDRHHRTAEIGIPGSVRRSTAQESMPKRSFCS
jgi:hypothetical protein